MAAVAVDPQSIHAFATAAHFERWLRVHHDSEREIYLRIYKKGSGTASVDHRGAIEVALCWGWIDGLRKSYDAESFLQRLSPRRARSIWSQINRDHVARLIEAGRMTPHGLSHVEAAKADGRWQAAYAGASTMTIPEDLAQAIAKDKKAQATFEKLDKTNRFALAFRLGNLKTAAARTRKVAEYVAMLARGEALVAPRTAVRSRSQERAPTARAVKTKK